MHRARGDRASDRGRSVSLGPRLRPGALPVARRRPRIRVTGCRGLWLLASLVTVLLSFPAAARADEADDTAAAEVAFREANRLMDAGKIAEACPKLAASHRLDPSYGAVYNLGTCYEALGKTASAWAAFTEAAARARKSRETERHDKAARSAAALEPKLVKLRVTVRSRPAGLVVKRSGAAIDPALWESEIPVDPGSYTLTASAPGKQSWSRTVTLATPGKTSFVEVPPLLESVAIKSVPPLPLVIARPASPEAPAHRGMSAQRAMALGAGGVGVAGVTVGVVFAVVATSIWDQARQGHCDQANVCDERGLALHGDARTMSHVSTAGFIAGGVGLAAGVTLWLTAPDARDAKTRQSLRVAPLTFATGGGLMLTGSIQ